MASRFRWFRLDFDGALTSLARHLIAKRFDIKAVASAGFRIERRSDVAVIGQFISKRTFDEKITLPSGDEFSQEITRIEVTPFGIERHGKALIMNTEDGPRSVTEFLGAFSQATNFSCVIEPIEVDIQEWIIGLRKKIGQVVVTYLELSEIQITKDVQARFAVSSSGEVTHAAKSFLGNGQNGTVQLAKVRFSVGGDAYLVELARGARLRLPNDFPREAWNILKSSMLSARLHK